MLDPKRLRQMLDYHPETGIMVWRGCSKYHRSMNGKEAGHPIPSQSGKLYWKVSIDGKKYNRSRLAFAWMTGRWPLHCIDHIDGNSENDRWVNLREATVTENAWNHKRRAKKAALPMGVRSLPSGRFAARIAVNRKMIHLGSFDTPEAASREYQKAREVHYGQFA